MVSRVQRFRLPEVFLGLLSISVAFVLVSHTAAGAIHDARHTHDTISVTASAKEPISANLVRWSLTVRGEAARATGAARRLRRETVAVDRFLRRAGIPVAAITPSVVRSEEIVVQLPHKRRKITYRVSQTLEISTRQIDVVEAAAPRLGTLLERGIDVYAEPPAYLSTELTQGKLGAMRSSSLGVYQVTPRDSTDVSDYGINDTSSREKDVTAVVNATFAVKR